MKKALVLSSGGIDSTTCIAKAIEDVGKENVATISVYYGQKHDKELEAARNIAKYFNVQHKEINLKAIFEYSSSSLLYGSDKKIQHTSYEEQMKTGVVDTYVPFRNGLMLSAVAAVAYSLNPNDETDIYIGTHAEDYGEGNVAVYADCSPKFSDAMGRAICIGTYGKVSVVAPFVDMTKNQLVRYGLEHKVPYEMTWSCYEGKDEPCGECATCKDCIAAFQANGANYLDLFKEL